MQNVVVQGLYYVITEIRSLKKTNKDPKEEVNLIENGQRQMESQLQEELGQKDELLKRITGKRQAHTKADIDCLNLLAQKDKKQVKNSERTGVTHWRQALQQELEENSVRGGKWEGAGSGKERWRKMESQTEEQVSLLTPENKQSFRYDASADPFIYWEKTYMQASF